MSEIKYKLNRDILIDKYHSGYHTFKKGTTVNRVSNGFSNIHISMGCTVVELCDIDLTSEAPTRFIVNLPPIAW